MKDDNDELFCLRRDDDKDDNSFPLQSVLEDDRQSEFFSLGRNWLPEYIFRLRDALWSLTTLFFGSLLFRIQYVCRASDSVLLLVFFVIISPSAFSSWTSSSTSARQKIRHIRLQFFLIISPLFYFYIVILFTDRSHYRLSSMLSWWKW